MSGAPDARILVVAWTATSGRALDLAEVLDGRAALVYPRPPAWLAHPVSTLWRYLVSSLMTVGLLLRHRPHVVVVTNPPVVPPLLAALWCLATGGRLVLDSHPSSFGGKGMTWMTRLEPVHRVLARRSSAVLVTTADRARQVDEWGGRGLVLHEPPVPFPPRTEGGPPTVLFVGVFAPDEPVHDVVEAARRLPDVTFQVTGDPRTAAPALLAALPANVDLVGFLAQPDYRRAMSSASVVLTLTTEPSSVMRSAYEAVYARVPLVTSDTPVLRELFPHAVHCANDADAIAAAVKHALDDLPRMRAVADEARAEQASRWAHQLAALRGAAGLS